MQLLVVCKVFMSFHFCVIQTIVPEEFLEPRDLTRQFLYSGSASSGLIIRSDL